MSKNPTCKDGKRIQKIPHQSLSFLSSAGEGAAPPHRSSMEMDSGFVQPQFQIPNPNSHFGNPWCRNPQGARTAAITGMAVLGREGNSLHGTEPHSRR